MKRKLVSIISSALIAVQVLAMPIIANAEAHATYITDSCFTDCSIGGNKKLGYYGLNIIMDGSPWLSKGSASTHYETYMYDEERQVDYCNFYSNSMKGESFGAGSMYVYQRDTTSNFKQTFGYCQFDIRMHDGVMELNIGEFSDPTSNMNRIANRITFQPDSITASDGAKTVTVANIAPEKWYTVKIVVDNILQEVSISVTDVATGKMIGSIENAMYKESDCGAVKIWCFGYKRNNEYNYDLTHVTISKWDGEKNPYSIK